MFLQACVSEFFVETCLMKSFIDSKPPMKKIGVHQPLKHIKKMRKWLIIKTTSNSLMYDSIHHSMSFYLFFFTFEWDAFKSLLAMRICSKTQQSMWK